MDFLVTGIRTLFASSDGSVNILYRIPELLYISNHLANYSYNFDGTKQLPGNL